VRRATIVLRKIDAAGRPVRQIELCDRHAEAVIARERKRGFEIFDRRDFFPLVWHRLGTDLGS
jgi:hypothetical protein